MNLLYVDINTYVASYIIIFICKFQLFVSNNYNIIYIALTTMHTHAYRYPLFESSTKQV